MKQSEAALYESKLVTFTVSLFNERHRGDYHATPADVISAHRNLNLLNERWPDKHEANAEVQAIQAELDRLIVH